MTSIASCPLHGLWRRSAAILLVGPGKHGRPAVLTVSACKYWLSLYSDDFCGQTESRMVLVGAPIFGWFFWSDRTGTAPSFSRVFHGIVFVCERPFPFRWSSFVQMLNHSIIYSRWNGARMRRLCRTTWCSRVDFVILLISPCHGLRIIQNIKSSMWIRELCFRTFSWIHQVPLLR